MRDASGMIGRTEARAPSFPPRPSLCVGDIKRVAPEKNGNWIGAFGGTGELHLLLDRCVGQRARGTCCPPFLLCFENRVNGEWAEGKEGGALGYVIEREGRGIEWRREAARQGRNGKSSKMTSLLSKRRAK
ncbi:hypothetical protein L1887_58882 [Cichorium endivia]|nr:hypothetical protein L1887_58882 [Cichorium endivia]